MTNTISEQVSALVDGELPEAERELLYHRLENDGELQSTWQRYHLIRDAMHEDLPEFINKETDVTYLQNTDDPVAPAKSQLSFIHRFAKPLAGLSIAASVAMLAVIGVSYNDDQLAPVSTPQLATTAPVILPDDFRIVPRSGWASAKPAVVSHLNGYLVDHSNYAGFGSAQGIIPYSRVAGYDQPMPDEGLKENVKTSQDSQ